jgi:hypothetical protein
MSALLGFIIMIAAVAWVVTPLFRSRTGPAPASAAGHTSGHSMQDLIYQKKVAADIIQDLHFDLQTGKLSPEDHKSLVMEQEQRIAEIEERLAHLPGKSGKKSHTPPAGLILLLMIALPALNGLAQTATFSGRLLNGSRDSSGVADQKVTLQIFHHTDHAPRDVAVQTTGSGGAFSFRIPAPDTGSVYIAVSEHQGVRYYSDQASFARTTRAAGTIVLFDSTQSNRGISVLMHHLFVQDMGEALALRETRVLNNPGTKTILNAISDGHEHGAILRIPLPPWAQEITPISGPFGSDLHVHENVLYDTGVFEPGNRQISFTYALPWQRDRATLVIQVDQPTRSLDLFVSQQQNLRLEGSGLLNHGPFTIRGQAYQRYGVGNALPGSRIELQVIRQSAAQESMPPWVTLAATGALLLLGVTLARLRNDKRKPAA